MTTNTTTTSAPAATKKDATPAICACGCKQRTTRASATYIPGHDARHAGQVARTIANDPKMTKAARTRLLEQLPSTLLQAKAEAHADRLIRDAEIRAVRANIRQQQKEQLAKIGA